jgi:hypothetical protein
MLYWNQWFYQRNLMNTVENNLEKLQKVGPYKLMYYDKEENIEVLSMDDILKSRFNAIHDRLSPDLKSSRGFSLVHKECGTVLNVELAEFFPCCGKALGKRLFVKDFSFYSKVKVSEGELDNLFAIYFDIVEQVLKYSKYSSFSFIVSKTEQPVFYNLITKLGTYNIINQFNNQRMSNKNLCLEYCKNLWKSE